MPLTLKSADDCKFDAVSLGEVMLRLDPGEGRIHTTRSFAASEGGGEYNVVRGLRRCFGLNTAVVTALADNPVGRLIEDLMYQGGVDQSYVKFVPYDGLGRATRNGLNFVERGYGPRGGVGCSDRGHTAVGQLAPGDIDWKKLFGQDGARWLHTGGIFCGLSESTSAVCLAAMKEAKANGTCISYDLNYRDSLWRSKGGKEGAKKVNRSVASMVDVLFGNEEDFSMALGFEMKGVDEGFDELPVESYRAMLMEVSKAYPNLTAAAVTLRSAHSASFNGWGALALVDGELYLVPQKDIMLMDRVGGGDSFASGFIYGLMTGQDPQWALECGVAHGALAMSTPGDTTMASFAEVKRFMAGPGARIQR